jgi:hypothetical protein
LRINIKQRFKNVIILITLSDPFNNRIIERSRPPAPVLSVAVLGFSIIVFIPGCI